jgi:Ca2+-binding EF-hand superfamily protein
MIKKFDKNGDGKLDEAERAEAAKSRGGAPGAGGRDPAKMQEMIKKYDKNGDGKLDETEKAEAMKARGGAGGKPRPKPENK